MSRNKREGRYAGVASCLYNRFKSKHVRYGRKMAYEVRSICAFSVLRTRADENALRQYRRGALTQQK